MMIDWNTYSYQSSWAKAPMMYNPPHPESMTPMPYQKAGVEYHMSRNHAVFGDAPGLGKTAQSIMLDNAIESGRTLVVCPASLRLNWQREIWLWSNIENVSTHAVLQSSHGINPEADFNIVSYDMLRNPGINTSIMDLMWDHVILDEAHYLKDPKGNQRTKVVCAPDMLPSVTGRFTLATGTLLPNQPIECYNALRLLDWEAIDRMSVESFRRQYYAEGEGFVRINGKVKWMNNVRNVPINLDDLQFRLRSRIMVRRLKEDVLPQLPPKRWHIMPLESTPEVRRALKHEGLTVAAKMHEVDPDNFADDIPIDGAISTARRELGEAKAPLIVNYVKQLLDEGIDKLVLAGWHLSVLSYFMDELKSFGATYMDGSTPPSRKQTSVDRFQTDPEIRLIIGQMLPMGEGWTMTAAQDVVLAEPFWVPGKNEQMLDRVHRIGQTGDRVIGHIPVVADSLDERIINTVIKKDHSIYLALDHKA